MANLTETATFDAGIYQLETTDYALGGAGGIMNLQAQALANRTTYLNAHVEALEDGSGLGNGTITSAKLADGVLPSHIRNTVLSGPVNAQGSPFVLDTPFSTVVRFTSSVGSPLVMTFAAGYNDYGPIDYIGVLKANTDVTAATYVTVGSSPVYAYVERDSSTGVLTCKLCANAPTYAPNAPTSPTNGDFWFDTNGQKFYKRVAGVWTAIQVCFIGYVDASGGNLTSGNTYEFRRNYDSNKLTPPGTVSAFAGSSVPFGWLLCNGAAVSRTLYRELFLAISTTYGTGDGSTTFNLPDLRGEFVRGLDAGRGVDSGRALGSAQSDELKAHTHTYNDWAASGSGTTSAGGNFGTGTTGSTGGSETRPRNVAMNYIIKF